MGAVWSHGETPFAQGGSGYVLSAKVMEELIGKDPGVASRFDENARGICCGMSISHWQYTKKKHFRCGQRRTYDLKRHYRNT